jgi:hypothetical protein
MMTRACMVGFALLCTSAASFAQLDQVTKGLGLGSQSGLSDSKVASGLKEALQIGEPCCQTDRENGWILWKSGHQDSAPQESTAPRKGAWCNRLSV